MRWQNINKKPEERERLYVVRLIQRLDNKEVRDMAYLRKDGTWDTDGVITHYLDETPSPDPDILVKALEECFAPGNLTVIGTIPSLYVEKLRLAYDEYKTALSQYKGKV